MNHSLIPDIKSSLFDILWGVKLVWAPPGAGKATTVRRILPNLQTQGRISGATVTIPPVGCPLDKCFRSYLKDVKGLLLKPNEKLSLSLSFFNQARDVHPSHLSSLSSGLKMLCLHRRESHTAHHSQLKVLSDVVLVECRDAALTVTIWDWNGHHEH